MTREIARNTHLVPNDEEVKMENQAKMREHELERKDYISGGGVLPMTSRHYPPPTIQHVHVQVPVGTKHSHILEGRGHSVSTLFR